MQTHTKSYNSSSKVALTVLEAHLKICRDLYSGNLLTEGVKQVTAVMYATSPEKVSKNTWMLVGRNHKVCIFSYIVK